MFQKLNITVEGQTPLLMCSPAAMLLPEDDKPTTKKKKLTREQEAELRAYRGDDGNLVFPAVAFRSALLAVATAYKVPKSRKSLQGFIAHVRAQPEFAPVLTPKGKAIKDYVIDSRRGVNRTTKGGIVVHRPKIEEWRYAFTLVCDPDLIPVDDVVEQFTTLLNDAGNRSGVGAFRPSCNGWFGTFKVVSIALAK
jgi:hypothetical protein